MQHSHCKCHLLVALKSHTHFDKLNGSSDARQLCVTFGPCTCPSHWIATIASARPMSQLNVMATGSSPTNRHGDSGSIISSVRCVYFQSPHAKSHWCNNYSSSAVSSLLRSGKLIWTRRKRLSKRVTSISRTAWTWDWNILFYKSSMIKRAIAIKRAWAWFEFLVSLF